MCVSSSCDSISSSLAAITMQTEKKNTLLQSYLSDDDLKFENQIKIHNGLKFKKHPEIN